MLTLLLFQLVHGGMVFVAAREDDGVGIACVLGVVFGAICVAVPGMVFVLGGIPIGAAVGLTSRYLPRALSRIRARRTRVVLPQARVVRKGDSR